MLRTRLLTATAAVALFAAPAAFAQDSMTPAPQDPVAAPAPTPPVPADPSMPAMPETTSPATAPAAPAAAPVAPAQTAAAPTPAAGNTVVDVLRSNGQFTTLLTALESAGLTATLSSQPAISIFAPTDAAFAALPEADRTRLMDPANAAELRQLLLYHVIVADVNSSQIKGAQGGVETAARSQVQLNGTGDALMVDDATVVQADIDASNGAIFAIDKVLNPAASQAAMGDAETVAPAADDAPASDAAPADEAAPATDAVPAPAAEADAAVDAEAGTTVTTPTDEVEPMVTDTAPDGSAADSVSTTSSTPVPNPADTPAAQQPDATNAAPTPTTADEVAAPVSSTVEPDGEVEEETTPAPATPQS